ncbi:MAG: hypothetical protein ACE37B_24630 [Ilumatobacter sp.]|uniref:hypothetical protein n=1 Tax=Ilumatobacter sp. TaxID=1967498 RepID=UPI00391A3011
MPVSVSMGPRGIIGLPFGSIEPVVVGDLVDDRVQLAAERLGQERRCELGDLCITSEELGAMFVTESAGDPGQRIGVFGADLALAERVVEPGSFTERFRATLDLLGGAA